MSRQFDAMFTRRDRIEMERRSQAFCGLTRAVELQTRRGGDTYDRHLAAAIRAARRLGLSEEEVRAIIAQTREEAARG